MNRNKQTTEIKRPKMINQKNYDQTKKQHGKPNKTPRSPESNNENGISKGLRSDKGSTDTRQNNKTTEINDRKRKNVS